MKEIVDVVVHTSASLPSVEVVLLLAILTFCLLFKTNKLGLIASFLFSYRWGWLVFERSFGSDLTYMYGYLAFGILALSLMVIGMVRSIGN
jgi:hypothetical protein